jgi:hypothetical protein
MWHPGRSGWLDSRARTVSALLVLPLRSCGYWGKSNGLGHDNGLAAVIAEYS